jgi:hypothetical protein
MAGVFGSSLSLVKGQRFTSRSFALMKREIPADESVRSTMGLSLNVFTDIQGASK